MQIKTLTISDIDKIKHLQPDGWPDITDAFKFYCNNNYCSPVKVIINNEIAGVGCSIHFQHTAWLAHIIVDTAFRRQGVGAYIVQYLSEQIRLRGITTVLLIATAMGESVYTKAGFRFICDYLYFKRDLLPGTEFESDHILLYKEQYFDKIMRLDNLISGENREILLKRFIKNAVVYFNGNEIEGYYIPALGEGSVFAITQKAGIELLKLKLTACNTVVLSSENLAGIEFIKQNGFVQSNTIGKRMLLGNDILWNPKMLYSRIGGNFG